jgi:thiol-disulfide isomerase/thioredoxin
MKIIRIVFLLLLFVISIYIFSSSVYAQEKTSVVLFYSPTCPHCVQEKSFLKELEKKYPDLISIKQYEAGGHIREMEKYYEQFTVSNEKRGFVPFTIVNNRYFVGFDKMTTGKEIESIILKTSNTDNEKQEEMKDTIRLPLFGTLSIKNTALPVLAVVLGFLDGFNVCSLGALMLILALVLGLKSRAQTLVFGSTFIMTTAVVYGLLIVLWYRLFTFLTPIIGFMELFLGLVMIVGALYFFKEFIRFLKSGPTCGIGPAQKIESKFSVGFKKMIEEKRKMLLLLGFVLLFALVITIVEFPCSAAVPVVFAGILSQSDLSGIQYFSFISLYTIFYLLDELAIFSIAFVTAKLWLVSPKWSKWIVFIQSIIMFALGSYYLLRFI